MAQPIELVSEDGETALKLEMTGEDEDWKTVVVNRHWPSKYPQNAAMDSLLTRGYGIFERDMVAIAGHPSGFTNEKVSHIFLQALGYQFKEKAKTSNGVTRTETIFRQPTVRRLNRLLDAAFPEEDSIRFAQFEGGEYQGLAYFEALARRNEVLVPNNLLYEFHDHTVFHILAWTVLGGGFSNQIREVVGPFVDRAEGEALLPRVPNEDNYYGFLHPSERVLDLVLGNIDTFTTETGVLITESPDGISHLWYPLRRFEPMYQEPGKHAIPIFSRALEDSETISEEAIRRYNKIVEVASQGF